MMMVVLVVVVVVMMIKMMLWRVADRMGGARGSVRDIRIGNEIAGRRVGYMQRCPRLRPGESP